MARIARWERPLTGTLDRVRAWTHMLLSDHGIFRVIYLNLHKVTPDVWRAAQPTPYQIARLAKRGVKTIVCLRGGHEHGGWPLEKEACASNNLALRQFVVRSRGAPERETLLALPAFFADVSYPIAVHCKSGADRAGFMSALYLILVEKRPVAEAKQQLHWRFGHFRFAKTGILDAFLEMYERDGEARGLDLPTWVAAHYEPEALEAAFRPHAWSTFLVDRVLRRE
jgi:protein tyrosine phosphatase (PTP) superfamily phosphohydrolase (DUF442 family)